LQIVWFYINWWQYWLEAPIFRKIYSVILNFSSKIDTFQPKSHILVGGRTHCVVRMTLVGWGAGSKLTAYDLRLFLAGEGRPTTYYLESVGGRVVKRSYTYEPNRVARFELKIYYDSPAVILEILWKVRNVHLAKYML